MVVGGTKFWSGSTAPSGAEDGDLFLDTDNEKLYHQVSGSWSLVTDLGGNIWTSGATVPANSVGEDGDFFFKTGSNEIYSRTSGTWTLLVNVTPSSMTNAEVKTAYEANADTNEFSDAEQTKLAGIASGADNVGTGTAGQVLKTNSGATGIEWGADGGLPSGGTVGQVVTNTAAGAGNWADAAAGGKILQVLSNGSSLTTNLALSYVTMPGSSITITPLAANSRFLYVYSTSGYCRFNNQAIRGRVIEGSTEIKRTEGYSRQDTEDHQYWSISLPIVHTPTYTLGNTVTYYSQMMADGYVEAQANYGNGSSGHFSYIMEIGA
jgi:hypothetical protein